MKHLVDHSFCTNESTKRGFSNSQCLGGELSTIEINTNI